MCDCQFSLTGICALTASHFANFFFFSHFLSNSLIINKKVGSRASSRMLSGQAELPKTAQNLRTSSHLLPKREVNKNHHIYDCPPFYSTSIQVTTVHENRQKKVL
jgi:hypothetical protein